MSTEKQPEKEVKPTTNQGERVPEASYEKISEIAYLKAEHRNFESGYELDDWLEAEKEYLMKK